MAAELIGGAFLSASLELLFDRMASQRVIDFVRRNKLQERLLKELKIMLISSNRVLNDAEMKQLNDPDVRKWLDELKDSIYNAEDLVYEINTEALRCDIEVQSGSSISQVLNMSSRFTVMKFEQRIVEIHDTLKFIVEQKGHLGLKEGVENKSSSRPVLLPPLEEESGIYGRDADKETIIKLLLSDDDAGGNNISVIPIVGMGGIGKTTLAQLVYNDVRMKNFDIRAWITVSDQFDVFTLTRSIFERVAPQPCSVMDLFQLQLELKEVLKGKKFLFVLDDIWNENYDRWYALKSPFEFAAHGSKIIVTTRNEKIASMMGNIPNHDLQIISDDDSWHLFAKHAFNNKQPNAYPDLEVIGRKIVNKCQGLPLAIKSLGGLLRSEVNPREWEKILMNDIWGLPRGSDILPALWLSYYYLSPHLKRCFAYSSIFPKNCEFEKEKLILLWMAEDLLQPQPNKMLEEVGEEYFNDLTSRSFFHHSEYSFLGNNHRSEKKFTMHDLINDLANFVSREFCLRLDHNYSKVFTGKTRYLSCEGYDIKKLEDLSNQNKVLRTLLFDGWNKKSEQVLKHPEKKLQTLGRLRVLSLRINPITPIFGWVEKLKLLRYLDLSGAEIEELPDTLCTMYNLQTLLLHGCSKLSRLSNSIGKLKHLRYLDLFATQIEEMPDTVCDLHNLHTLIVDFCMHLSRLPTNMSRLVNLRNLKISNTGLTEIPRHISKLKHLQSLSEFIVDKNGGVNIKELGSLQSLHGFLRIKNLENAVDVGDVSEANLKDKEHITNIKLQWNGETDDSEQARMVLDRLEPHTNIQHLTIWDYQGTSFPSWIGHHSFSHIVSLNLVNCRYCYWLPPLGQLPSLKFLNIIGFDMVERIGDEFYCSIGSSSMIAPPFKSLQVLKFINMPQWKEWSSMGDDGVGGAFSQLKRLELQHCPNINGDYFPHLPSSTTVIIAECKQLVASFKSHQFPWLSLLQLCDSNIISFPEGGLPSNIHTITISRCYNLESLAKEGWPSNLKSLEIFYCASLFVRMGSFPEEGQLPTTLTSLKLQGLPNLKSLNGKALQHLFHLETLSILCCYNLQCLPEQRLPSSVYSLNIMWCNRLSERCQRDTGEDWQKIVHIPRISIDNKLI